jgi:hypothetical protein
LLQIIATTNTKKERYIIEIQYGSDFQEQVYKQMLEVMLATLKVQMEDKHKKNSFKMKRKEI